MRIYMFNKPQPPKYCRACVFPTSLLKGLHVLQCGDKLVLSSQGLILGLNIFKPYSQSFLQGGHVNLYQHTVIPDASTGAYESN